MPGLLFSTVSELLRENQQGEGVKFPPPQIRVNNKWKKKNKVVCNLECVDMRPEIKYNQKKKLVLS